MRGVLGCQARFVSRPTVERLLAAARENLRAPSRAEAEYIEPGIAFWRLVLLVNCYVQIFIHFHPPTLDAFIEPDQFRRVANFLRRWGAPPLSAAQAEAEFERIAFEYGHAIFFHELCDWAMRWLLSRRGAGGFYFTELERYLSGVQVPTGLRPSAAPLALL